MAEASTSGRVYVRIPAQIQIGVRERSHDATIWFLSRDLSVGGVFLKSDLLLEPGTHLWLRFRLGDGPEHEVRGTIVWARAEAEGPEEPPGMGVAFESMPLPTMDALSAMIRIRAGRVTYED